jgi:hypothetical protein
MELLTGIHRKAVYHYLTKQTVIDVCSPQGAQHAIMVMMTEIAEDGTTLYRKTEGKYKYRRNSIYHPYVNPSQQTYQPSVHQSVTKGLSVPVLVHVSLYIATGLQNAIS